jgi:hypothetical protein
VSLARQLEAKTNQTQLLIFQLYATFLFHRNIPAERFLSVGRTLLKPTGIDSHNYLISILKSRNCCEELINV